MHSSSCLRTDRKGGVQSNEQHHLYCRAHRLREDLKYCPHGRTICVSLSKKQIEKQFKRT